MALETVTGNLKDVYRQLVPGTMLHVDQLTTERRTNLGLRGDCFFYTADGGLYTINDGKMLWSITREPQNLVLQNMNEAYGALIDDQNYFPLVEQARSSFEHPDTVVVDVKGLSLIRNNNEYGYFIVDPTKVTKLNSQQRLAAQRIYGSNEDNFRQNLEMFAEARIQPQIFVLMPNYVQDAFCRSEIGYLARASWLNNFNFDSHFSANDRSIDNHAHARGVRRGASVSEQEAPAGRDAQNGSAFRNSALSEEERVEQQLAEILSPFDKYIGTVAQEQFQHDKQQAVRELLELVQKGR